MPLNPFISDTRLVATLRFIISRVVPHDEVDEYIAPALLSAHGAIKKWHPDGGKSFRLYITANVLRGVRQARFTSVVLLPLPDVLRSPQVDVGSSQRGAEAAHEAQCIMGELTERQQEILGLWARGLNYSQIARSLGVSRQTVNSTLASTIRRKRNETQNRKD